MTGVSFSSPVDDGDTTFLCSCGFAIQEVGYYSYMDEKATQRLRDLQQQRIAAPKCGKCGAAESIDRVKGYFEIIKLKEHNGQNLCQDCLADQIQSEEPDPSTSTEKYAFNRRSLKWVLTKVKRPCRNCNTQRWLNVENRWKDLCTPCYKKQFQ
jgi:hypothetical protein